MFDEFFFWKATCPWCGSADSRRAHRTDWQRRLGLIKYRCLQCRQPWFRLKALPEPNEQSGLAAK
jgi:hypothetical protein